MRITTDYVISRNPCCPPYNREHIEKLMDGRKYVYPKTVFETDEVSTSDKLWLFLHPDFIPEMELHELACVFAERCKLNDDSKKLIRAKRDWIAGKITDEELDELREAHWATNWAADGAAGRAAYWAANRVADMAAYWATDWTTSREWQLERIKEIVLEDE